jgi:chromate transporter
VDEPVSRTPAAGEIFLAFLHLGLTAFGGLAMVEPIRRQVVETKGWLSQAEFLDGVALCQVVPGATVVQLATYVGYRLQRVFGALAAAAGFILPAFGLMLVLSALYFRFGDLPWVQSLSKGLGAVVIALLLQALWRLGQAIRRHWVDPVIALLTLAAFWLQVNYLMVILTAGSLRLLLTRWLSPPEPESFRPLASLVPNLWRTLAYAAVVLAGLALAVAGIWRLSSQVGLMSLIFLKIGVISFGGGYVMIPILQWEMVDRLAWLTLRQFLDGLLLGFVTPGPIIILATFVGYWVAGVPGAAIATVSIFLPPILIIVFLAPYYQRLKEAHWMRPVIQGILTALVGMLILVLLQMGLGTLRDLPSWMIMAGASLALIYFEINLVWVVAAAAGVSLWMY